MSNKNQQATLKIKGKSYTVSQSLSLDYILEHIDTKRLKVGTIISTYNINFYIVLALEIGADIIIHVKRI